MKLLIKLNNMWNDFLDKHQKLMLFLALFAFIYQIFRIFRIIPYEFTMPDGELTTTIRHR